MVTLRTLLAAIRVADVLCLDKRSNSATPSTPPTESQGSAYDTACDSCPVEDYDCTIPYYDIVQLCEPVLKHTTSSALDGTLETLRLEPGYWRSSNRSRDIRECYEADACVGGVQDLCASGYEGPCECTSRMLRFNLASVADSTRFNTSLHILLVRHNLRTARSTNL